MTRAGLSSSSVLVAMFIYISYVFLNVLILINSFICLYLLVYVNAFA